MAEPPPALRPAFLAALSLPAAPAGCAHKNTIVGNWQDTVTQPNGSLSPSGSISDTFNFTPDGRETIHSAINQGARTRTIDVKGTYTVNGKKLTQSLTTMTMNFETMPIPPSQASSAPFTLDGDHLTLTNPRTGEALTLARVRE